MTQPGSLPEGGAAAEHSGARPSAGARASLLSPAIVLAVLLLPPSSLAQESGHASGAEARAAADTSAELVGHVLSRAGGGPIGGAQIRIPDLGRAALTDSAGRFRVEALPAGELGVLVDYLGYSTNRRRVRLAAGHVTHVRFLMERDVLVLEDLRVEIRRASRPSMYSGYYRRKARGIGEFIDQQDIEERDPEYLSDMMRTVPGVRVGAGRFGGGGVAIRQGATLCHPKVFLDGVPTYGFRIDNVLPRDVVGIEVYHHVSRIPPQFNIPRMECGVVVIWTKDGTQR